jgi:predicted Zn-dependent protease
MWTVFVFLEIKFVNNDLLKINKYLDNYKNVVHLDEFHISISKTVNCEYDQIDKIVKLLKNQLKHFKQFYITLKNVQLMTSQNNSKEYITLLVDDNKEDVLLLINEVDQVFDKFNFDFYYDNPVPHVSIGYLEKNVDEKINLCFDNFSLNNKIFIKNVNINFGNSKLFKIDLLKN